MLKYLIDVNLPNKFVLWHTAEYIHQREINDESKDDDIWKYAIQRNLTIISKDSDFSSKILFNDPPPKVIHIRIGNMKISEMFHYLNSIWDEVLTLNKENKLVNVYVDRLEAIK